MRRFNIETIKVLFLDEADVFNTSDLVRKNLTDKLKPNSLKIFTALQENRAALAGQHFKIISESGLPNITQTYIQCDTIVNKIHAVVGVYKLVQTTQSQCIVFCRVKFSYLFRSI